MLVSLPAEGAQGGSCYAGVREELFAMRTLERFGCVLAFAFYGYIATVLLMWWWGQLTP